VRDDGLNGLDAGVQVICANAFKHYYLLSQVVAALLDDLRVGDWNKETNRFRLVEDLFVDEAIDEIDQRAICILKASNVREYCSRLLILCKMWHERLRRGLRMPDAESAQFLVVFLLDHRNQFYFFPSIGKPYLFLYFGEVQLVGPKNEGSEHRALTRSRIAYRQDYVLVFDLIKVKLQERQLQCSLDIMQVARLIH